VLVALVAAELAAGLRAGRRATVADG